MLFKTLPAATTLCVGLSSTLGAAYPNNGYPDAAAQLQHWPAEAANALTTMIKKNANQSNFAVFDMDNTSYRYDIEESLLPFLENRGILTRNNLDPSLKLIDFKDTANYTESLYR